MEFTSSPYPTIDSSPNSSQTEWQHQRPHLLPVPTVVGIQEAMLRMTLGSPEASELQYPERPDEPDCSYYMRTGLCSFGANCKFNHPPNRRFLPASQGSEFPERYGEPECQYYLKTGTCKFGASCKYHHPREKAGSAGRVQLNFLNLPLRPGEKDCPYYMRTGSCKYGVTCKFNHPVPSIMPMPGSPMFPGSPSSAAQVPHIYPGLPGWPISRPPFLPSRVAGPSNFTPILIPSPQVSVPPWGPYPVPFPMPEGQQQQALQGSYILSATAPPQEHVAIGVYPPLVAGSGSTRSPAGPQEDSYPERPGQPECQYYMRTGTCRYGSQCRFHHPKERNSPFRGNNVYGSTGFLPRPGATPCMFYDRFGYCKYGPTCKYDHSFIPSAFSQTHVNAPMGQYLSFGDISLDSGGPPPISSSEAHGQVPQSELVEEEERTLLAGGGQQKDMQEESS